jgi:hypothetical protein
MAQQLMLQRNGSAPKRASSVSMSRRKMQGETHKNIDEIAFSIEIDQLPHP